MIIRYGNATFVVVVFVIVVVFVVYLRYLTYDYNCLLIEKERLPQYCMTILTYLFSIYIFCCYCCGCWWMFFFQFFSYKMRSHVATVQVQTLDRHISLCASKTIQTNPWINKITTLLSLTWGFHIHNLQNINVKKPMYRPYAVWITNKKKKTSSDRKTTVYFIDWSELVYTLIWFYPVLLWVFNFWT